MRTRTTTDTLYSFDELTADAQERAAEEWAASQTEYFWAGESRDSVKEFCDAFNVTTSHRDIFDLESVRVDQDDVLELTGVRLRTWLLNNHYRDLFEPKYMSRTRANGSGYVSRRSKIQWDPACPTGYCLDYDLRDALHKFLKDPASYGSSTLEDLLRECLHDGSRSVESDMEHQSSFEYFKDHALANGYEFLEDGTLA